MWPVAMGKKSDMSGEDIMSLEVTQKQEEQR